MSNIEKFLTVKEIAQVLKLHPYTIRRLCRERKIPCTKFGGQWRFSRESVLSWTNKKG